MANKYDMEDNYRRWWRRKYIRVAGTDQKFKLCVSVKYHAPPSGIYGTAVLTFSDGSTLNLPRGHSAFRPTKKEIEVRE